MKRTFAIAAVLAILAGCAPKTGGEPAAPAGVQTRSPSRAAQKKQYEIAVLPKGLVHQFWLTVKAGALAAGEEFHAEILWKGPEKETEVAKQIGIVEDMITREVDAIVMAACDENALVGVLEKADRAGIPVVTIDSGVTSDTPITFVATDNIKGANLAARELARLIGEEGEVALIPFVRGAATSEMREKGFIEGIQEYPNIKLVAKQYSQSLVATGMAVTEDIMTANPGLDGIFAANESGAMGAAQALNVAGKAGAIKLVAFDASDEEIAALENGTIQALIVQNPFKMGYEGVKAAVDHLEGRPVEKRIDTGVTVVTRENLETPEIQKLLHPLK
ncbi:MAG TPA: ABC transporter substrate-binding protein [Candidatus Hydrogenedentes bacterium]|nr:ABC transporter substrate-binding protein [Candidatus Hydrogenedentota bacterium]